MNKSCFAAPVYIKKKLRKIMKKKTFTHTLGTAETAVLLAGRFGADKTRAETAALLHDCAKDMSAEQLERFFKKNRIKIGRSYKSIPAILHGPAGEHIARRMFKIKDREILDAIKVHSTGSVKMGITGKILYVSDFIEPGREYKESKELRKLLKQNISLDSLVLHVLKEKVKYLKNNRLKIHPATKLLNTQLLKNIPGKNQDL
jgi:predicted HD superfamily hydrolase involved in NAD metabolism